MNEYKVKVVYGDKTLVECMEEVLRQMIYNWEEETMRNIYIDKMVELMELLDEKHQYYAVKIMEELVKGWIEKD